MTNPNPLNSSLTTMKTSNEPIRTPPLSLTVPISDESRKRDCNVSLRQKEKETVELDGKVRTRKCV